MAVLAGGTPRVDCVKDKKRGEVQASINKVQKEFKEDVAKIALVQGVPQEELDQVSGALNEAIYHTGASHADFARWKYDPETVANRMLERLAHDNSLFKSSEFARQLARGTLFKAFMVVRETEVFQKSADIYCKSEVLTKLDAIDLRTQLILEKMEKLEGGGQLALEQDTETSIRETIRGLITAQEGARKRAGAKLEATPPDPQGAKTELLQLAAQQEGNVRDAARTYLDIGNIAYMNDTHEALAAYIRVTELTPDNPEGWMRRGHLLERLGEITQAEIAYQKLLQIAEVQNDSELRSIAFSNIADLEQIRGNLDAAVEYYEKALALNTELGHKQGMASNYGNLGIVVQRRGDLDAAVEYYEKSLALNTELGRKQGMASDYGNLGIVAQTRGDLDAACGLWRKSYNLFVEIGAQPQVELVGSWIREAGCTDAPKDTSGDGVA